VNGSWKSIEISLPRRRPTAAGLQSRMFSPRKRTSPELASTPVGSRPMIARALSDLPLPDSPTTAIVSPGESCRLTLETRGRRIRPAT